MEPTSPEALLKQWQAKPTPEGLKALVDTMNPAIEKATAAFAGQNAGPTVKARARLLAADAIRTYNPASGAKLSSHIYGNLQRLTYTAPKINDPLPVPEQMRRDRGAVLQAAEKIREGLGREPDDDEVAELAGLPIKRVKKVRRMARRGVPLSALDSNNEDDDGDDGAGSIIGSVRTDEDDWLEAVDYDLSPVDKQILRFRTGYQDHPVLPNHEIARRLGISPAAVSQRAARIQQRLDSFYG